MTTENLAPDAAPNWQPLPRIPRRILGVLVEKAKTTPDGYPLSLNALTNGCNQKSNRDPVMDLSSDDVEEALDSLREMGAIAEVHGGGRVVKYRHYMKDWLGVDGTELAVVAELLLRGAQTVGDLRGRAARMASGQLPDVNSLRPVIELLVEKKLVVPLTPAGRGQMVTHGLFPPQEIAAILAKYDGGAATETHTVRTSGESHVPTSSFSAPATTGPPASATRTVSDDPSQATTGSELGRLQAEVSELRAEVARLRKEIEDIWSNLG